MTKGEQARLMAWRLRVLQHAAHEQNVARICRRFGISRKSFYKWKQRHAQCGDARLVDPHPSGWPATDQLNRTGNVGEPLV